MAALATLTAEEVSAWPCHCSSIRSDFDGLWTTRLADRYLPLPELPTARYECIDGRLVMTPTEVGANSYGEITLAPARLGRVAGAA
jgi:hypothetical protein